MTIYYEDALVTLHHADALPMLRDMPDESVDIVVTSPPYNMGLTPGGNGRGLYRHPNQKAGRFDAGYTDHGDDALDPDEYNTLRRTELQEMWRIARHAVYYNHRPRVIHGVLTEPLDGDYGGLPLRQRIILARPTGIDVGLDHYCTRGEYLLLFAKPTFRLADHASSGLGDVWPVPIVTGSEHPAPFDESIPARCITTTGATSILDPFAGSGTTLLAAKRAGITGVGIERDPTFCALATERLGGTIRATAGSLFA